MFFEDEWPLRLNRKEKYKMKQRSYQPWWKDKAGSYQCVHCKNYFHNIALLSGVQNRNHCPYCLWSLHLDLINPGDRLAACRAPMQPIGLTSKLTLKKYSSSDQGEVMLVHHCMECGKISINRIAADDDVDAIMELAVQSSSLDATMRLDLEHQGIRLLPIDQIEALRTCLFGKVGIE
jgi:DNA-directed RNA polymerase subunit RPC12/RpoP